MTPPVFSIASVHDSVAFLLGRGKKCRLYLFGEAEADVEKPYAVWQLTGGNPENLLAGIPNMDNFRVQIDAYGDKASVVRAVGHALINAFEPYAYVTYYNFEGREPETRLYRYSFTVEFMTPREAIVS